MLTQITSYGERRQATVTAPEKMGKCGYTAIAVDDHGESRRIAGCRPIGDGEIVTIEFAQGVRFDYWRLAE